MNTTDTPTASTTAAPAALAKPRLSLFKRIRAVIERYRDARVIVVGYGFFAPGGAWKSIHHYYSHLAMQGENVILIARPMRHSARQMVMSFFCGTHVVVNGLDSFFHLDALLFCLLRRDVLLYLHETEFIINEFRRHHPLCYQLARVIIRRNRICCVSRQQESFLRERFGTNRTHVVYENITPNQPELIDARSINIVMVGSVETRKGPSLFSRVADLAHARNQPWRFYWIGPTANPQGLYASPRVRWLGARPDVYPYLTRSDLFFLSSEDDPFPLACLEALSLNRKCVVYRKTGLAEVVEGIAGCGVFETYDEQAAFASIERALNEELDLERVRQVNENISSVTAFAERMAGVLAEVPRTRRSSRLSDSTQPTPDVTRRP